MKNRRAADKKKAIIWPNHGREVETLNYMNRSFRPVDGCRFYFEVEDRRDRIEEYVVSRDLKRGGRETGRYNNRFIEAIVWLDHGLVKPKASAK